MAHHAYKYFYEFWEDQGVAENGRRCRHLALMAWNAAANNLTMAIFSNSEVYTEARIREFEVRRTKKSDEDDYQEGYEWADGHPMDYED